MKKLTMDDLQPIAEYELERNTYRKSVLSHKQPRRINIGPDIAVTFEDRTTMTFQIQEMMRAETMTAQAPIEEELDIYNTLIPEPGQLSATLFIEITQEDQIKELLQRFIGLTEGNRLWLEGGGQRSFGEFEQGRSTEDQISSVHYIKFDIPSEMAAALENPAAEVSLNIDMGDYRYRETLTEESRRSLSRDLLPD